MKLFKIVLVFIGLEASCRAALKRCNENVTKLSLCSLTPFYSKGTPAKYPLILKSSVTLQSLSEFNEEEGTITANILLASEWIDERISLKSNNPDEELRSIPVNSKESQDIFFPALKIKDTQRTSGEKKFGPLTLGNFYWFFYPNTLEYQESFKTTIYCPFDFTLFPFDSHVCIFGFGAGSGLTSDTLQLVPTKVRFKKMSTKLGKDPIQVDQSLLPFDVWIESMEPFVHFEAGFNYSYAGMKIRLERNNLGLLLGGYYGPTAMFSLLSLISFVIKPDVVPGRLGLLITLDLIASNVYNSVYGPDKRGFSYIEIWNLGMQFPILLAIFEYAAILALKKFGKSKEERRQNIQFGANNMDQNALLSRIDATSFLVSLTFITIFIIVYWASI